MICQWEISVAMVTTVLIHLPHNLMQTFLHPKDTADKIRLKSAKPSWTYICSKVWTTMDDNDGALLYYKLTFGSGDLKMETSFSPL